MNWNMVSCLSFSCTSANFLQKSFLNLPSVHQKPKRLRTMVQPMTSAR